MCKYKKLQVRTCPYWSCSTIHQVKCIKRVLECLVMNGTDQRRLFRALESLEIGSEFPPSLVSLHFDATETHSLNMRARECHMCYVRIKVMAAICILPWRLSSFQPLIFACLWSEYNRFCLIRSCIASSNRMIDVPMQRAFTDRSNIRNNSPRPAMVSIL